MNNNSFHHFSQLPLELRRLIWKHCLPYRIAEQDMPDFLLDGNESRQACWADRITYQNAQLPVIAFVNSESRQVALEQGRRLELDVTTSLKSIWIQPRRDVLHINWSRMSYKHAAMACDPCSPIDMFLWHADDLGMRPSIVADIIYPFSLKALLDGADSADSTDMWSTGPCIKYKGREYERNQDVSDITAFAEMGCLSKLDIAMAAVSLHITRKAALRSGLFGLLGDAPVQMVDVDNKARLREFQALFREHALEKEPAVQTLFELFISPRFQTAVEAWKRQAEWLILAFMWQSAREENLDILGTNPGSAWVPYLPEQEYIWMSRFLLNEKHAWVKQARQSMPKLRLRIMVRYCTNECYIKERLPEGFGAYY
ncbi:2EXR domain-containing protein [Aspergillus alliaceus]|uniref:2EXR domain-containing protein n=1 Tax=Petromyces alliaceus TaxID=209559 RepID=UPI0012A5BEBE|nr:uncharacterized protein BDW43DRAFT_289772 [Aspergillus alliaceus]KAB8228907.1 hypothetical protein BDW43DRAFT_289772 [Aspergillus alliaceus]